MNIKLEKLSEKKNGFTQHLYNPIVWVIVGTALLGMHAFFVQNMYVKPAKAEFEQKINAHHTEINKRLVKLEYQTDTNTHNFKAHQDWCADKLSKELENRPTTKELRPQLKAIENNIADIKEGMKIILQKLR